MILVSQQATEKELHILAKSDRHSVIIEGPEGSGKTWLSRLYGRMLGIEDFQKIEPKVNDIRETIEACHKIDNKVVICIENLDTGVFAASSAMLKFLEEPQAHVYIVVTCRNLKRIQDTIVSRSASVTLAPPTETDLIEYAKYKDEAQYLTIEHKILWKCVKTLKNVEDILEMQPQQLDYFTTLDAALAKNDSVSNLLWTLQHYADNSLTPIELVIRYIMYSSKNKHTWAAGHSCLKDLALGRISTHIVLAKFVFDHKYTRG